jgi:hypothetical protein
MKQRWTTDKELELICETDFSNQGKQFLLQRGFKTVWAFLVTLLTKEPEIQVRQVCRRNGITYWQIHDPSTGQSVSLASEEEVIGWIEQNYYQRIYANDGYSGYWHR